MKRQAICGVTLMLGACAAGPVAQAPVAASAAAPRVASRSADGIIGHSAARLQALFGAPVSQISEGSARKLQFAGPICVLDAYLYPSASGQAPSVVHVDTRRPTGEDIDRASCVAALRLGGQPG